MRVRHFMLLLVAAFFILAAGCAENENPTAPESTFESTTKPATNFVAGITDDSTVVGDTGIVYPKPPDSSTIPGVDSMPPYWRCDDTLFNNVIPKDLIQEPYLGLNGAKATIAVVGNLSDDALRAWWPQLMKLHRMHPRDLKIVFVNMQPAISPVWPPREKFLARACEAANQLGKFWEFADVVAKKEPYPGVDEVYNYAEEAGINLRLFKREMDRDRTMTEVESDYSFTHGFGQRTCCQFYDGSGGCSIELHNTTLFIGAPWLGYFRFFPDNSPALEDVSEAINLLNCGRKCFEPHPMKPPKEPVIEEKPGPTSAAVVGIQPIFQRLLN